MQQANPISNNVQTETRQILLEKEGKMHVLVIRAHHISRSMLRVDNNAALIGLATLLSFATLLLQSCSCLQCQTAGAFLQHSIPRQDSQRVEGVGLWSER